MEKKLEDFFHLYLPIAVELDNGGSKVYNRVAVGIGNMDDGFKYVILRMGNGTQAFTHSELLSNNRVKPILRHLSDMTEEEKVTLALLEFSNYKEATIVKNRSDVASFEFRNENGMLCYVSYERFSPETTRKLIKKGFDLFQLIEAGLAINKASLNK